MRQQDAVGIGLSGLCLIHCLGLPLLISLAPAVFWLENEITHITLACLALFIALGAARSWPEGLIGGGISLLAATGLGLLFFGGFAEMEESAEQIVTSIGAVALASAHIIAWQRGRHPVFAG